MGEQKEKNRLKNNHISQKKIKDIIQELKKHNPTKQDILLNLLQEDETTSKIFDEKTIETLEKVAKHIKEIKKIKPKLATTKYAIPLSIFSNRTLSTLEHIISYLKEQQNLTYQEISVILNRDPRTIWTTYQRAKKKRE